MASKTFLQLQTEFADLHKDTSTTWAAGGTNSKLCLNDAQEYLWDRLKNSQKVRRFIATQKASVTISDKVWTLPAAFDTINFASVVEFDIESDVDVNDSRYFDFEVRGLSGAKSIYIRDVYSELFISYVPIVTALSADSDVSALPPELHRCIPSFALFEYYRRSLDDIRASNALALANSVLNDKLASLG